jgi:hypothetical protein
MGEAVRMRDHGVQFKQLKPGEQIQVDLKNATEKLCACGHGIFVPGIKLYTVSALVSPTGQEMMAQQPVLVCMRCNEVLR